MGFSCCVREPPGQGRGLKQDAVSRSKPGLAFFVQMIDIRGNRSIFALVSFPLPKHPGIIEPPLKPRLSGGLLLF